MIYFWKTVCILLGIALAILLVDMKDLQKQALHHENIAYERGRESLVAGIQNKLLKKALVNVDTIISPLDRLVVTSRFGMRRMKSDSVSRMHWGVDWSAPSNTPIYAAENGCVVYRYHFRAGYYFKLAGKRFTHKGCHLLPKGLADREVKKGDIIGFVGSTGKSTGPHLHYECYQDGKHFNPQLIFNSYYYEETDLHPVPDSINMLLLDI